MPTKNIKTKTYIASFEKWAPVQVKQLSKHFQQQKRTNIICFIENDVLPAWELIFQPELSSHASKTAIFDFKKQGFHLPVFFTFFQLGRLNLIDTGLIYATEAPNKSR